MMTASTGGRLGLRATDAVLLLLAAVMAAAVGWFTAQSLLLAIEACAAIVVVSLALLRPKLLPPVLVVSIFASTFTVGGLTVQRFVAPLAGVATVAYLLRRPVRVGGDGFLLTAIAAYAVVALASLLWTVDLGGTLFELASLSISLAYVGALMVLVQDIHDVRALLWTVAACAAALGAWWIVSYLTGVDRRFNLAGDPNFFAALEVVALPMVLSLLRSVRSTGPRLFLFSTSAIIAASIVSSLSRGGLLALLVAVVLIVVLPARLFFQSGRQKAVVFAVALGSLSILGAIAGADLSHRFQHAFTDPSLAAGRGDLALAALNGFQQHPVVGLGFGAFKPSSFELLRTTPGVDLPAHLQCLEAGATIRGAAGCTGQQVHNAYLESLVELGPLGLLTFAGVFAAGWLAIARAVWAGIASPDPLLMSVLAALAIGLVTMAVSSVSISTETSRTLWLIIGMVLAVSAIMGRQGGGGVPELEEVS
jgi:O-antigen ligase